MNDAIASRKHGIKKRAAKELGVHGSVVTALLNGSGTLDNAWQISEFLEILPPVGHLCQPWRSVLDTADRVLSSGESVSKLLRTMRALLPDEAIADAHASPPPSKRDGEKKPPKRRQ